MKRFILTIIVAVAAVTMLHAQQKSVGVMKYGAEPLRFSSVEEWESVSPTASQPRDPGHVPYFLWVSVSLSV